MEMTYSRENPITIYGGYEGIFGALTDEEAGRVLKALISYRNRGEAAELGKAEQIVFCIIRQDIDAAISRAEICRANGRKGGRPRKEKKDEDSGKKNR